MRTGLFFILLFVVWGTASATSAQLEIDRQSLAVGDELTLTLTIVDDAKEDITEVKEPDFSGFDLENRGESSSSSISIVNGSMTSRKERIVTYILRPQRGGQFTIGPAVLVMEKGKEIRSNQVRLTVTGSGAPQNPAAPGTPGTTPDTGAGTAAAGSALFAPLSAWEKQTGRYFIRVVVSPEEPHYRGEPLVVSYYLFTQKNLISDLSFYRLPSFENGWSDEIEAPRKLSFSRTNIDGTVYDHALLKRYILIPDAKADRVGATQMILDVMTGGFFDTRKRALSSIALSLDLAPLPDADKHPAGIVGDLSVTQSHTMLTLDKQKPLDTVTYTVTGCGNLQQLDLSFSANSGLKIFAPDVKIDTQWDGARLCGTKTFKFMVKGLRAGSYELPAVTLDTYDRQKGWQTLATRPVAVTVGELAPDPAMLDEAKRSVAYELLRELPAGMAVYDLTPLTEQNSFRIALALPLLLLLIGSFWWLILGFLRTRREKKTFILREWERRLEAAPDATTLLNTYYDAVAAVTGIALKGERVREMEKRNADGLQPLTELVRDLQNALYSGSGNADLAALKGRAVTLLRTTRRRP